MVVPDPAKGSKITSSSVRHFLLIKSSTHAAEKPAEYLNHRWTGSDMLSVNAPVLFDLGRVITGSGISLPATAMARWFAASGPNLVAMAVTCASRCMHQSFYDDFTV